MRGSLARIFIRVIRRTALTLVLASAALWPAAVAPHALAVSGPLAGRSYAYVKVLPKDAGWHSPTPQKNVVVVRVGQDGTSLEVGWGMWSGNGCSLHSASGRPGTWLASVFMHTTLTTGARFHVTDSRPHIQGWRYDRREAYGRFSPAGGYFDVRIRQKAFGVAPSGDVVRCDGRWLTFRARLQPPGAQPRPM